MFCINTQSGVDISAYSSVPSESEILLVPGTCLMVQSILILPSVKMVQMDEVVVPGLLDYQREQ